jgi:site-specific recombinase XerD
MVGRAALQQRNEEHLLEDRSALSAIPHEKSTYDRDTPRCAAVHRKLSGQGATLSRAHFHLQVLRGFYDFLNLGGLVSYVAPSLIKIRRPPMKLPRVFTEYQVRKLIAATQTVRERALIEFFYGTG